MDERTPDDDVPEIKIYTVDWNTFGYHILIMDNKHECISY